MKKKIAIVSLIIFLIGLSYWSLNFTLKKESVKVANILNNYTIFIDPGHGGKDNGTCYNEIAEDEINLNIASMIYESLINDGAYAFITRTGDYDLSDMYATNHKIMDLNKRISYILDNEADLYVSIHLNAYSDCDVSGAQVFYRKDLENSKNFATIMQEKLNKINKKDKKPKTGDYYLLNNTEDITGIIVECGFLSNPEERKQLTTIKYQKELSEIICDGIIEYLASLNSI